MGKEHSEQICCHSKPNLSSTKPLHTCVICTSIIIFVIIIQCFLYVMLFITKEHYACRIIYPEERLFNYDDYNNTSHLLLYLILSFVFVLFGIILINRKITSHERSPLFPRLFSDLLEDPRITSATEPYRLR